MTVANRFGPVQQLVVQATPFCNLDCDYCYLPKRSDRSVISLGMLEELVRYLVGEGTLANDVEFRWHAGEPLVVPFDFYERALARLADLVPAEVQVRHSMQTNATTLNPKLARRIGESGIELGLSIDGPQELHDASRKYRSGRGSFKRVMEGVGHLRDADVEFDVIAVLTPSALIDPEAYYRFFVDIGARSLGLNIEESEGSHVSRLGAQHLSPLRSFLSSLWSLAKSGPLPVREFSILHGLILNESPAQRDLQNMPGRILSLATNGDIATYSPELLGLKHVDWPNFAIGNVSSLTPGCLASSRVLRRLTGAIEAGVGLCQQECGYYEVCGGGRPVNKLYENGTFESTETLECRTRVKALAEIVVEQMLLSSGSDSVEAGDQSRRIEKASCSETSSSPTVFVAPS